MQPHLRASRSEQGGKRRRLHARAHKVHLVPLGHELSDGRDEVGPALPLDGRSHPEQSAPKATLINLDLLGSRDGKASHIALIYFLPPSGDRRVKVALNRRREAVSAPNRPSHFTQPMAAVLEAVSPAQLDVAAPRLLNTYGMVQVLKTVRAHDQQGSGLSAAQRGEEQVTGRAKQLHDVIATPLQQPATQGVEGHDFLYQPRPPGQAQVRATGHVDVVAMRSQGCHHAVRGMPSAPYCTGSDVRPHQDPQALTVPSRRRHSTAAWQLLSQRTRPRRSLLIDDDGPAPAGQSGPTLIGMGWFGAEPGGLNRFVGDLLSALRAQDENAVALVASPSPLPPGYLGGVDKEAPLLRRWAVLVQKLRARSRTTSVVDSHFALYGLTRWCVPGLRAKPFVVHFHGPWADESTLEGLGGKRLHAARKALERFVYRSADELITLSYAFRSVLVERYGVLPSRVQVLRPGVDLTRFVPADRTTARERLGVPEVKVVLAVRRLSVRMGLDVLLRAWVEVHDPAALLVIAGSGAEGEHLRALARELGIDNRVRFLGRVEDDDLPRWYAAADLSVVPSTDLEGFGLIVLESLACGTPVVASDTGGMAEILPELDQQLLVPPGDRGALAARLNDVLASPEKYPGRAACRQFAERFEWTGVAEQTMGVYERSGRPPARRPVRAVFLTHSAKPAGGELAMIRLIGTMTGIQPHVILGEDGPLVDLLRARAIDFEVLPIAGATSVSRTSTSGRAAAATALYSVRLSRRLRQLRPDVVYANSLRAAFYGLPAARMAGLPGVWHVRDRITSDYLSPGLTRTVRTAVRHLPDAVIANSAATLATLRLPADADGTVVASPLVPQEQEEKPPKPPAGPLVVTSLGRLAHWKGQHIALQAFAVAFPYGTERLRIVGQALFGEHDYADGLRRLARELGVADRVDFLGHREDVPAILASSHILVHSSILPEPFGNAVVEGMAAGLAVVASDGGGPREIITDGVDGLLTPLGNVEELAAALRRLAGDAPMRDRLGAAGQLSAARFHPDVLGPRVEAVLRRVLRRRLGAAYETRGA